MAACHLSHPLYLLGTPGPSPLPFCPSCPPSQTSLPVYLLPLCISVQPSYLLISQLPCHPLLGRGKTIQRDFLSLYSPHFQDPIQHSRHTNLPTVVSTVLGAG